MLQLTFMGIYPTLKLKTERGPLLVIVGWLNPWLNPPFVVADPVLSLFSMRPDVGSSKVRHALQVFKQKFTYARGDFPGASLKSVPSGRFAQTTDVPLLI